MKKRLLTNILWLAALCANAQSTPLDISQFYLSNSGFDSNFNYKAGQTNNVAEEIKAVAGWTADLSASYTIVGTYEFGFKGVYNTATVPATGYDGESGGGLAFSTGWEQTFKFYQTVSLPAGTYTLRVPTYNGSNQTAAISQVAWILTGGTPVTSTVSSYATNQWKLDQITFTLTKTTTGKIQFGMKAAAGGSGNSAKLLVDYVQLLGENMSVDKTILTNAITNANKLYNETAHEAVKLKEAIDAAQNVYDNADADMTAIVEAASALNQACETFYAANDMTSYITNPSFEDGFKGWTNVNMLTQTNSAFAYSVGNIYVEKWVKTGAVGNASVKQTIKNLPNGIYELTVAAQNLTESSPTTRNTGAYIFAVDANTKTRVYTPGDYTLKFNSIAGEVEIGFVAENAKGNWICADNFRLRFIGALDAASTLATLQEFITKGEGLQTSPMAGDAATTLSTTISYAKTLTTESSTEDIQKGTLQLQQAIEQAQTSIAAYKSLQTLLTRSKTAQKSNMSITASTELAEAITQGDNIYNNPAETTDAAMADAIEKLNAAYTHAQTAITEYKSIATQLRTATSMQESMMSTAAKNALTAAINDGQAITTQSTDAEVQSAAAALTAANAQAKESVTLYKNVQTELTTAERVYDETLNEAELLKAEIDKANELVTNGEAEPAALVAEVNILKNAVLAFRIANATPGSGTPPAVTQTNHYVATGATQALVRATIAGSNILEQGVCWSTERNPTVLDNRSTKSFSLRGTIFHVTGMKPATVYYVRPYVMNKTYTVAYGDEVKIVTHPQGTCTWSWNRNDADDATDERCRNAIKETIDYFNEWTGIMGFHLTGNYVPGAGAGSGTADCSYGGWMRISQNQANQAIGTVLHETGHGVGVGTQARWSDTNLHNWTWLGRETNDVFHFLENVYDNSDYVFVGDGTHGWGQNATYDWLVNGSSNDKHLELQYIGGMCVLHGMFIDGLDPTSGGYWYTEHNGIPGYTYNFDDDKKYYLMCKDANRGLGEGLLYQRAPAAVGWKPCLTGEVVEDDAAWYMEFVPATGYYRFKNVASGKYLTHSTNSTSVSLKSTSSPSTTENFQLMPDRTDVSFSIDGKKFNTHGYWFTWTPSSSTFKSMSANTLSEGVGYGAIAQADFNYANSATTQQWIILSEDELADYQEKAIATGIQSIAVSNKTMDGKKSVVGIYTTGGVQLKETQPGFNIIRYSDGTTQKIFVK